MTEPEATYNLDQIYQKLTNLRAVLVNFHDLIRLSPMESEEQDTVIAEIQNLFGALEDVLTPVRVSFIDRLYEMNHL